MSAPEPYIPLDSLRSPALRRDLDALARDLLALKEEMAPYEEILKPLEQKREMIQKQINEIGAKLPPHSRRVLARESGWKMHYRRGRTTTSDTRLLELGVDVAIVNEAKVEGKGSYIVTPIETGAENDTPDTEGR